MKVILRKYKQKKQKRGRAQPGTLCPPSFQLPEPEPADPGSVISQSISSLQTRTSKIRDDTVNSSYIQLVGLFLTFMRALSSHVVLSVKAYFMASIPLLEDGISSLHVPSNSIICKH